MDEAPNMAISEELDAVHRRLVTVFREVGLDKFFNRSNLNAKPEGIEFPVLPLEVVVALTNRLTDLIANRETAKLIDSCDSDYEFRVVSGSPLDGVLKEHHVLPVGYTQSMVKVFQ